MASSVIFIHVPLCVAGTGEEVPRNAHKPFLPLRWILVSHRSSLENALYQVSFPLFFFFFFLPEKYAENHSIGFEPHEWEQEPTPEDKCSDLYRTQITENNNK